MFESKPEVEPVTAVERAPRRLQLCADSWVEVRSKEEILATLDEHGRLDGMPFMPEMLQYCGKRLRVFKRAHKTCDTITWSGGRRVEEAVHLEDVRCDGSAHGGCEAACMIFWKEAWLKPVIDGRVMPVPADVPTVCATGCDESQLMAATQRDQLAVAGERKARASQPPLNGAAQETRYACQATSLLEASRKIDAWNLSQYVEDFRSGNVGAYTLLRGFIYRTSEFAIRRSERLGQRLGAGAALSTPLIALYDAFQRLIPKGVAFPRRWGKIPKGNRTPAEVRVSLRPGSWVRVKSYPEILATLDTDNKNRGLYFDAEHVPYCGRVLRVRSLVNKIIEEKSGRMLHFRSPAIILEGAYCQGTFSDRRMFCPRAIYPYWRALWLTPLQTAPFEPRRLDLTGAESPHAADSAGSPGLPGSRDSNVA